MTTTGRGIRPATAADRPVMTALADADRVPGQPVVTDAMLAEAIHGRSPIDGGFWDELGDVEVDVLTGADRVPIGAVSYAARPRDLAGVILWLHGREDPEVVAELVAHALTRFAGRPVVEAFPFATALGLGLEALPVRHRAVTDAALRAAGFVGDDLWRYLHRRLPAPELPRAEGVEIGAPEADTRLLTVREDGRTVAEATVGLPVAGIGTVWWIGVDPTARGRGLGRALLGSALDVLSGLGAGEVILYVDDDDPDPGGDRDRTAANRLYDAAGFVEVDRLHSYRLAR